MNRLVNIIQPEELNLKPKFFFGFFFFNTHNNLLCIFEKLFTYINILCTQRVLKESVWKCLAQYIGTRIRNVLKLSKYPLRYIYTYTGIKVSGKQKINTLDVYNEILSNSPVVNKYISK